MIVKVCGKTVYGIIDNMVVWTEIEEIGIEDYRVLEDGY